MLEVRHEKVGRFSVCNPTKYVFLVALAQALVLVFALQELASQSMPSSTDRLKVAQPTFSPIFTLTIMLDCLKTSHFQFIVAR